MSKLPAGCDASPSAAGMTFLTQGVRACFGCVQRAVAPGQHRRRDRPAQPAPPWEHLAEVSPIEACTAHLPPTAVSLHRALCVFQRLPFPNAMPSPRVPPPPPQLCSNGHRADQLAMLAGNAYSVVFDTQNAGALRCAGTALHCCRRGQRQPSYLALAAPIQRWFCCPLPPRPPGRILADALPRGRPHQRRHAGHLHGDPQRIAAAAGRRARRRSRRIGRHRRRRPPEVRRPAFPAPPALAGWRCQLGLGKRCGCRCCSQFPEHSFLCIVCALSLPAAGSTTSQRRRWPGTTRRWAATSAAVRSPTGPTCRPRTWPPTSTAWAPGSSRLGTWNTPTTRSPPPNRPGACGCCIWRSRGVKGWGSFQPLPAPAPASANCPSSPRRRACVLGACTAPHYPRVQRRERRPGPRWACPPRRGGRHDPGHV